MYKGINLKRLEELWLALRREVSEKSGVERLRAELRLLIFEDLLLNCGR